MGIPWNPIGIHGNLHHYKWWQWWLWMCTILTRLPDFVKLPAQNDRWRIRCCARLLFWSPCSSRWHPNSCASNLVELHCLKTEIYQQQIYLRVLGLLEFQKHTSPIQWHDALQCQCLERFLDLWWRHIHPRPSSEAIEHDSSLCTNSPLGQSHADGHDEPDLPGRLTGTFQLVRSVSRSKCMSCKIQFWQYPW